MGSSLLFFSVALLLRVIPFPPSPPFPQKLKFSPTSIFRMPCAAVGCMKNGDVIVPL